MCISVSALQTEGEVGRGEFADATGGAACRSQGLARGCRLSVPSAATSQA